MIQLRTMKHIPTSQTIRGMRSLCSVGRSPNRAADSGRIQANIGQLMSQDIHRVWLLQQWRNRPLR
ncbi:MAG: hypothetical protein F6K09_32590 [Merismopedia sp. SIO2A8]|nr:hypothetical protein [Merismopedia sp. SIO2A8]